MKLERTLGTYSRYQIDEILSFAVDGSGVATNIRDGKTGLVTSVTHVSAGLYTINMRKDRPTITRHVTVHPTLAQPASPTTPCSVHYVVNSWSQANGTFQVQVLKRSDRTASDPDNGDRISVQLRGSISSAGTDAA